MNLSALESIAKSIRTLSMDAVEKAQSGHPGLPMGCAEIGSYLFSNVLNFYPEKPDWLNRDRFILSAGHGSMLLYSLLHMSGYDVSLDDIKNFRQFNSKTPGHPEYPETDGVETSTGPLGQGIANGVGMAIASKRHAQKFNKDSYNLFDNRIFVLVGDGDLMEGLSYEACSIAGHLKLDNLIAIYDSNKISIEGSTSITFTEDVAKRFDAFGWEVIKINGHDFNDIKKGFDLAEKKRIALNKPVIIIADTVIGKGSPKKQATSACHGAPLGKDEITACKLELKVDGDFYVAKEALDFFAEKKKKSKEKYDNWQKMFLEWGEKFPDLKKIFEENFKLVVTEENFKNLPQFNTGEGIPTRSAAHKVLNSICKNLDFIVSGSADLGSSTMTIIKDIGDITPTNYLAHNIQYGVREHAMGAIANGLYLYGGIRPIVGTFLSFVNYMKPSIRMAALMKLPIIYLFSHDSIYVGEDGPSHHPVEHLCELRFIPNVNVMRPMDAEETKNAWKIAFDNKKTPQVIITTRQKVPVIDRSKLEDTNNSKRGGCLIGSSVCKEF
ncbi:MAG TPA: transketolase, partial [Spirochaetota bacterium]|nr:transketolase [Spirochaetota bacterium]